MKPAYILLPAALCLVRRKERALVSCNFLSSYRAWLRSLVARTVQSMLRTASFWFRSTLLLASVLGIVRQHLGFYLLLHQEGVSPH